VSLAMILKTCGKRDNADECNYVSGNKIFGRNQVYVFFVSELIFEAIAMS